MTAYCPSGYSYCSSSYSCDCYKYSSYNAYYGVVDYYTFTYTSGSSIYSCMTGYTRENCSGVTCYCRKYGYYCGSSSYTLSGSICYRYTYSNYYYYCPTGTASGGYCYLYNQGTSCPSGWGVSDYTEYGFKSSEATVTSCFTSSSFTCSSSNSGKSYVSYCTPKEYSCSSGTKLNNAYCYEIN